MANSADSDQIAFKEYLIKICTIGKGILDATSTFGHMEKTFLPTYRSSWDGLQWSTRNIVFCQGWP